MQEVLIGIVPNPAGTHVPRLRILLSQEGRQEHGKNGNPQKGADEKFDFHASLLVLGLRKTWAFCIGYGPVFLSRIFPFLQQKQ
jgi:hypothetical protein